MRPYLILLLTGMTVGPVAAADPPAEVIHAATVHDGRLLCLSEGGAVAAWELKTGAYATAEAGRLSRKGLNRLEGDGDRLWAADGAALYEWSAMAGGWEKRAAYEAGGETLVAIVPVGGTPYLVFPSAVVDPVGKRPYPVPKVKRPRGGPPLRILATHGTAARLWVGTGNGEWGGDLLGLDVKTGTWVHDASGGGYVTGITHATGDEVIVSWSMDHFGARTEICVHKADGTRKTEHGSLAGKYYQRLAYNPGDRSLYGIEARDVVTIEQGKPTKVAGLDGRLFEREPNAIGVAPGVLALIPAGKGAVVVVPKVGGPTLVRDGKVTRLVKPKP
ncbi:hypothetical protein [Limnoglobus roseus]|uniref:WD40 repeat domain-containing protein n=1 Tax=Limnoglobus roseus TaxID=2598579 RepID=A0A5C1AQ03_9BACT|nr:hypothetical protein [Limnoglobus roseus]QEL20685.1 hypothetical protein PX52LOC_07792 [Limnoglobus roseus]